MDTRLQNASINGDVAALAELMKEGKGRALLGQVTPALFNTCLHISASYGHAHFTAEVLRLLPELALARNKWTETPLHIACREGKAETARLLLESNPSIASCTLIADGDQKEADVMTLAAIYGRVEVVKMLLSDRWLPLFKVEGSLVSSLLEAASRGHADVVREILMVEPDACKETNEQRSTALHLAASNGHVELTKELLQFSSAACWLRNKEGRTPLHLAAMRGSTEIMDAILSASPNLASVFTGHGESVLHLCVMNRRFEALQFLVENYNTETIINSGDQMGNTVLHLAAYERSPQMVSYIVDKTSINVNAVNNKGLTALDIEEFENSTHGLQMISSLRNAGARSSRHLEPAPNDLPNTAVEIKHPEPAPNDLPNTAVEIESAASSYDNRWIELRKPEYQKIHRERLLNSLNTITVVAVLIATVSYSAGFAPPGGLHQDGDLAGRPIMGGDMNFKRFMFCNGMALCTSLAIVLLLVFLIPITHKALTLLHSMTCWAMLVSVVCMLFAYTNGIWMTWPMGSGLKIILTVAFALTLYIVLIFRCIIRCRKLDFKGDGDEPQSSVVSVRASGFIVYI